jgi:hypothetical protein
MKKILAIMLSLTLAVSIVSFLSCGSGSTPTPAFEFPANSVSISKVYDIGNNGNSTDIRVDFKISTTDVLQKVEEARLIVSKNTLTLVQIKSLAAESYETISKPTDLTPIGRVSSSIKDSEGNAVVNDVLYKIYIVIKHSDAFSLSNAIDITLRNKPIYAGRYKGLWNDALFPNFKVTMILNDDYNGEIFYTDNFITCCPAGGTSDATVKFVINGATISLFEAKQFLGSYNGGNCPATYTAAGTVTNELTLSISNLTGTDCDGNHAPGTIVFTRQ